MNNKLVPHNSTSARCYVTKPWKYQGKITSAKKIVVTSRLELWLNPIANNSWGFVGKESEIRTLLDTWW